MIKFNKYLILKKVFKFLIFSFSLIEGILDHLFAYRRIKELLFLIVAVIRFRIDLYFGLDLFVKFFEQCFSERCSSVSKFLY